VSSGGNLIVAAWRVVRQYQSAACHGIGGGILDVQSGQTVRGVAVSSGGVLAVSSGEC